MVEASSSAGGNESCFARASMWRKKDVQKVIQKQEKSFT
jgi:hypothetical protein